MLRQIKPRNARSKRALEKRAPHLTENPKNTLFLRYSSCSQIVQLALADILSIKRPLVVRFNKKNDIHPFEDPSSLEFFSEKNDAALIVYGSNSKKRPHCLTLIRCFDHKVLDMLELYIDPETFRTLNQFKNRKCAVGLKPLISFSGTPFENPTTTPYTLAKSLLLDLFRGSEVQNVDVSGLQYIISISVGDEVEGQPPPKIHFRAYLIKTRKSGQKVPRVELEEMGPRFDFRIGRSRQADESVMKEALKRPKHLEPKQKKNIETDLIGDKVGRIHMGKQDLGALQTRKMKGLKRSREFEDKDIVRKANGLQNGGAETKRTKS
ncbi:MAG: rRNA-binding ribosome biosynthesis protein rpf2 [Bathelium mastoideum]|nr:MAG: rRNA-binding ribosome biosynthesis protein rpf2 [Bathelium mastoideum]KAI9694580.1 MAG: rRNA-binding ribosome biosynthesis protein rpf2 [Bathelium mastoideum]